MVSTVKCETCNEKEAKYKCPICRSPYCSVACCKEHKDNPKCKPQPAVRNPVQLQKNKTPVSYNFPTEDTVPPEKLARLGESAELRALLGNPHLQQVLKTVDQAPNASHIMEAAMQEPIFTEFADLCMRLVEPSDE